VQTVLLAATDSFLLPPEATLAQGDTAILYCRWLGCH
jgi:hypothetical protein